MFKTENKIFLLRRSFQKKDLRCYTLNGRAIALSFSTQNRFQTLLEAPADHQKLSGTPRKAVERPNPSNYQAEAPLGRPNARNYRAEAPLGRPNPGNYRTEAPLGRPNPRNYRAYLPPAHCCRPGANPHSPLEPCAFRTAKHYACRHFGDPPPGHPLYSMLKHLNLSNTAVTARASLARPD